MTQTKSSGIGSDSYNVLFVCTGNICRSPTAEAVFRHLIMGAGLGDRVSIDSAGIHSYHVGEPPDPRTIEAGAARGFQLETIRARKVRREDFSTFDMILAMDRSHHDHLTAIQPNGARATIGMFLDYHPTMKGRDVPDPYYGGSSGFSRVLDLIEAAGRNFLAEVTDRVKRG